MRAGNRENEGFRAAARGRTSRLSHNAIINAIGSIAYYAAVVVVTPLALDSLGSRGWGIWQIAGALTNYALLINLGLSSAVSNFIASAIAVNDPRQFSAVIRNASAYLGFASILLIVVFYFAGESAIASLVGEGDRELAISVAWISIVFTACLLPTTAFLSVLSGMQRYDVIGVARIAGGFVLILTCWVGFKTNDLDLKGFAAVMTIAPAFPGMISLIFLIRMIPAESYRWWAVDTRLLREMIGYSASTVLYTTGSAILYQNLKLVAAWKFDGPESAGKIGLVVSLAQALSVFAVPLVAVIHPRFRDFASSGRQPELPMLLITALTTSAALTMPVIVFVGAEAPLILEAWVGAELMAEDVELLSRSLRWMMVGQGPFILFLPCFYALLGVGRHLVFGLGMLVASILNFAIVWWLAHFTKNFDVLGFSFGLTLAGLVFMVTVPATLRHFGLKYWRVVGGTILRSLAACVLGIVWLYVHPEVEDARLSLVLVAVGYVAAVAPGILLLRRVFDRASA